MPDASHIAPWHDAGMVEDGCPDCAVEFATVWHVTVGTNLQGYNPVFGKAPVAIEVGRCNDCHVSFERIDGGPWRRQCSQ